jgi:hypothetical protein
LQLLENRDGDAVLSTGSANIAMQQTAKSAGFRLDSAHLWFQKPVVLFPRINP